MRTEQDTEQRRVRIERMNEQSLLNISIIAERAADQLLLPAPAGPSGLTRHTRML